MEQNPRNPDQTKDFKEGSKTSHTVVADSEPFKGSAKDMGLVKPPIVTAHGGQSTGKNKGPEFLLLHEVDEDLMNDNGNPDKFNFAYPFVELEVGQGIFVKNAPGDTTDKTVEKMYHQIALFRNSSSDIQRNENGDEILDCVVIRERIKNEDGTFQLSGEGKLLTTANQTLIPRYVHAQDFIVRPVIKDAELGKGKNAEADGVVIIRVV